MMIRINRLYVTLLFSSLCSFTLAQVNGNENIQTRSFHVETFSKVVIETPAQVVINAAAENTSIVITTDENIFTHIVPQLEDKQIIIEPDTWVEPTQLKIIINTPTLQALTTGGYGNYQLKNIKGTSFILDNPVGTVSLHGQVDQLTFKMTTGKLDARALQSKSVKGVIESFGIAQINVTEFLHAGIWNDGTIAYLDRPAEIKRDLSSNAHLLSVAAYQKQLVENTPPQKVKFRLRNNSDKRKHFFVRGPAGHRFSYGFPMNANQKRAEEWPVGTRVYKVGKTGLKTLLVSIQKEDADQVVDLF